MEAWEHNLGFLRRIQYDFEWRMNFESVQTTW
jgi:hypothetical protein